VGNGIVAVGKAGTWTVTIEELGGEEDVFSIWLEANPVYLQFNIHGMDVLRDMSKFLLASNAEEQVFELEGCLGGVLAFVTDDTSLRVRLNVSGTQMFMVRLDLAEAKTLGRAVVDALADVS
jgi:hypothetical protein